jgi:hypothetical protein
VPILDHTIDLNTIVNDVGIGQYITDLIKVGEKVVSMRADGELVVIDFSAATPNSKAIPLPNSGSPSYPTYLAATSVDDFIYFLDFNDKGVIYKVHRDTEVQTRINLTLECSGVPFTVLFNRGLMISKDGIGMVMFQTTTNNKYLLFFEIRDGITANVFHCIQHIDGHFH